MTINQQTKAPMPAAKVSSDPGASQGARRATEDAPGSAPPAILPGSDSEVVPRARRRTFTNADKRRILQAALVGRNRQQLGPYILEEEASGHAWRKKKEAGARPQGACRRTSAR